MSYYSDLETRARPVAEADVDTRALFISRTYTHLLGAVALFVGIEIALFKTGAALAIVEMMAGLPWLVVLGAFMIVSWLASAAAASVKPLGLQYAALGAYVAAEALIFVPLLWMADMAAPGVIQSAALVTGLGFAGLTWVGFWTRKDFSFLGGLLRWAGIAALLAIVGGALVGGGAGMGTWFSVLMIVIAGGAILYDTSNVLLKYPEDRYVSASLQLFASVALLFWYVLRIFSSSRD